MELITKKRSYRWNRKIPRSTTLKIIETFIKKRSDHPQTSGLKLLNESVQECGLDIRFNTWDKNHPVMKEIAEQLRRGKKVELASSSTSQLEISLAVNEVFMWTITEMLNKASEISKELLNKLTNLSEIKVNPQEIDEMHEIPQPKIKPIQKSRWTKKDTNGTAKKKRELGLLLAGARGNISPPGEPQWSQKKAAEVITASPFAYEGYIDFTGNIRPPINNQTICSIEAGRAWPCAKAIHALVECYELEDLHIEMILSLLPKALRHSIEHNLADDCRIKQIIVGKKPAKNLKERTRNLVDTVELISTRKKGWRLNGTNAMARL